MPSLRSPFSARWLTLLALLLLFAVGCGRNAIVGVWQADGGLFDAVETFRDDGTFTIAFQAPTPMGVIQGECQGDYSTTNTTLTLSVTSIKYSHAFIPQQELRRMLRRIERQAFSTQVVQIRWKGADLIEAKLANGNVVKMKRIK